MKRYLTFLLIVFGTSAAAQELATAKENEAPPSAADNSTPAKIAAQNDNTGFEKKVARYGIIFGGSNQITSNHDEFPDYDEMLPIMSVKIYYERFGMLGLTHEDAGVGFDLNLMSGFERYYQSPESENWTDIYYGRKLYVSGYAFRDFDLGNIITVGVMGGPSIVTNIVDTDLEGSSYEGSAVSLGIGIHTGQYVLKYIGGKDTKKFCLRLGFEQYISINSGFTGLFGVGIGF